MLHDFSRCLGSCKVQNILAKVLIHCEFLADGRTQGSVMTVVFSEQLNHTRIHLETWKWAKTICVRKLFWSEPKRDLVRKCLKTFCVCECSLYACTCLLLSDLNGGE